MATLTVTPANAYEGGNITFTLVFNPTELTPESKDRVFDSCFRIRIKDTSLEPSEVSATSPKRLEANQKRLTWDLPTAGLAEGSYEAVAQVATDDNCDEVTESDWTERTLPVKRFSILGAPISTRTFLQRAATNETNDQGLWALIRNRTNALGFERYRAFIDRLFCTPDDIELKQVRDRLGNLPQLSLHGPYAYSVLKLATQVFLTLEAGMIARASPWDPPDTTTDAGMIRDRNWGGKGLLDSGSEQSERYRLNDPGATFADLERRLGQYVGAGTPVLPYLDRIVRALGSFSPGNAAEFEDHCQSVLLHRFSNPSLLELIWSYWHEEGMVAQTMNAIVLRFQNQRSGAVDPLAELELDPLRPLNNLLWGYVQDENNRLTVRRRAFEYDHHYGVKLVGRAVPELQTADSRSKFIEAFHNLLYRTAIFYREDADTTIIADAFPLLNALKDVHLLLAEGAHNQYGDLPWTSRAEMLTEQWLLARPEMREFLRGRHMVPYQEAWMGAVDAMKKLQGWGDTTITHFNELAVDGERILLSIRFGDWSDLDNTEEQARNWARYWKPEIQRYLYGYLAVTGVDLMADITDHREAATRYLQPSTLLAQRLASQPRRGVLPAPAGVAMLPAGARRSGASVPVLPAAVPRQRRED
ncbi:hypothetical protein [Thiocapsa rosea]|uniref:Uncharacterized protein n=1 Tax=Thiocapsa rosea TaxID=69360 RepID=A0A495V8M1_9GAMM|nr:hypothetical protein [Thiocapsa rosea]RKT44865.1 hypothetical protein BDD21_2269 [Thiocapsa rosea]